jgi:HPt (histidine-containing phosphotransfer) domain-containing protein
MLPGNYDGLADAAHSLAGRTGTFGFARLATTAGRFEFALRTSAAEAPIVARDLIEALEDSLQEMRRHADLVSLLPHAEDPMGQHLIDRGTNETSTPADATR